MDEVSATVTILDRKYKLKIGKADEEALLKAANLIDTQARNYGKLYAYQDHQDLLAMVALTQITQITKIQGGTKERDTSFDDRLVGIEKLLDEALTKHEI